MESQTRNRRSMARAVIGPVPRSRKDDPMLPTSQDPLRITRESLFDDTEAAESLLHALRWPRGRALCPHCGFRHSYRLTNERTGAIRFKCARCRKQYSARRGTVLERSNVATGRWIVALWLALSAPGVGLAGRIQRATGVSHKTAWAIVNRIGDHPEDPVFTALRRETERGALVMDALLIGDAETASPALPRRRVLLAQAALLESTP
ncbi:Putative uncharacterized protein [Pararhodospirillum photometricum DSM 122]|uniref:Transposase zinc-ribbon domain-containing protein n=2 Tax=Pararhodospirillum photometricum TaxID=1084 RepID=H6SLG9_PARPM|nr:Putative uncharacterized protein [Pararhodospirillum photometricum DSM 122]